MVERIHQGNIGKILSAQLYYLAGRTGVRDTPGKSYDEIRIRNQYLFHALSGGTLLDQSIHMLDVCNWALQEHPRSAIGTGGIDESQTVGDTWKHFQFAYEYPSTNVIGQATHYGTEWGGVCARFIGTEGTAFIKSIETGNYLNDAVSGAESTLAAIMGREAVMSGEKIKWDNLRFSSQRLDPGLNLSQFDPE